MPHQFSTLLPSGFYDLLPPFAGMEARAVQHCLNHFAQYGYEQLKPPMLEFEESLLASASPTLERQTFRLMDPNSQKMMGLRADMTMQVARIALTRLQDLPQPLRICYSGATLHTKAQNLNPTREHMQVGMEIVGVESIAADVECIRLSIESLKALGLKGITVDINLPSLSIALIHSLKLPPEEQKRAPKALAQKNVGSLKELSKTQRTRLQQLCDAVGPYREVLAKLQSMTLPKNCHPSLKHLEKLIQALEPLEADAQFTLDPTENRGFDYHGDLDFAIFAEGIDGEIGSGGRYHVALDNKTPAIGVTLYISHLLQSLTPPSRKARTYITPGTPPNVAPTLHQQGHTTVAGLDDRIMMSQEEAKEEAKRLQCASYWFDGQLLSLEESSQ
jgi:ATP phosphoribosyltransferase regulatory subunit